MTIVERRSELRRIGEYIEDALHRRGRSVCLQAAAGLGKTALLREAQSAASAAGLASAAGTCWREGSMPYEPWLDILNQLQVSTGTAGWPYRPGLTGFMEVERALAAVADERPLLIELDDLHCGDEGTLLLTRYLAGRAERFGLVLLAAVRDLNPAGLLAETLRPFDRIRLSPLTEHAVGELCIQRGYAGFSDAAVKTLTTATGGVPLQVIVALESTRLDAVEANLGADLPAMITSRMDELPDHQAAVLAKAAVLGQLSDVATVAGVAHVPEAEAAAAIRAAQALSIARPGTADVLDLRHDLVRQAVHSWLTPAQRTEAEVAAADWFAARSISDPALLIRAAHHTVTAAGVDRRHARRAVELGRLAARSLAAQGAPEDSARLLERLIAINEADPAVSHALLLVEYAQAVLLTGRLGAAMRHFDQALTAALVEDDPQTVAEAAAGLGALWVNSIRSPDHQAHVLSTQRKVLAYLPPGFGSVPLRLRARIAAESMFWEAAPPDALFAVIDDALRLGDPATVVEVLSVAHNPLLGPQHTARRLSMAESMITRAAYIGTGVLPLMAWCWRTVDLFLSGDSKAPQSLSQLRAAAEATQSLSVIYIVRAIEAMVLIGRGDFAAAEATAKQAYELGCAAEDPDALSYLTAHLVTIGWYQGRDAELLALMEQAAGNASIDAVDFSFDAAAAAIAARAGQHDLATHYLNKITDTGLDALPRFSTWLMAVSLVVEAATQLDDAETLARAYALLTPYAHLPIMGSLAVVCLGSCHQWLGRAALALNRLDDAERHLRAAVDAEIHLGNLPALTVSRALLADCLTRLPDRAGRADEIDTLLTRCRSTAAKLEMSEVLHQVETISRRGASQRCIKISRSGSEWLLQLGAETALVRDLVGMPMLATLTSAPDQWFPAHELAYATAPASGTADSLLDDQARHALRERMTELADQIARARDDGDLAGQEAAENELDALTDYLRQSSGLGGRSRRFAGDSERARTSVRKALVRAIDEVQRSNADISAHLKDHIVTGATCCYRIRQ